MSSNGFEPQTRCSIRCPGSHICVDCADLRDLSQQLAEAEELTRRLRNRIAGVKSRVNAKMDPLAGNLPVEVICRIFELYADLDRVEEQIIAGCLDTRYRSGPLPLGAVCRRWREIAWSFPALWTTLALKLDCKGRALGPELVRQWLERAKGQPLAIQFFEIPHIRVKGNSEAFAVIDIINQFSAQWKVLDLSGLPYTLLKTVNDSQYLDSATPSQLTHICVAEKRFDRSGSPRKAILNMMREHCPTFLSFISSGRSIKINIDWKSVTHIRIAQSLYSFLEIMPLAAGSPLTHLSISALANDYRDIPSNRPVDQLRTLRYFSVTASPEGISSGRLYDTISLPSLRTFHMDSKNTNLNVSFPAIDHLSRLFIRSACPLLYLELVNLRLNGKTLISLLDSVPTLRTLTLSCVHVADALFSMLSEANLKKNPNPFLPHLSSLDIAISYPTNVWGCLADIWDENSSHLQLAANHTQRIKKTSLRKGLHVKLTLICTERIFPEHLMDRLTLRRMVRLWEIYGIIVAIGVVGSTRVTNFFEQSYQYHFSGDWKEDDIYRSLMAMLSSSS